MLWCYSLGHYKQGTKKIMRILVFLAYKMYCGLYRQLMVREYIWNFISSLWISNSCTPLIEIDKFFFELFKKPSPFPSLENFIFKTLSVPFMLWYCGEKDHIILQNNYTESDVYDLDQPTSFYFCWYSTFNTLSIRQGPYWTRSWLIKLVHIVIWLYHQHGIISY